MPSFLSRIAKLVKMSEPDLGECDGYSESCLALKKAEPILARYDKTHAAINNVNRAILVMLNYSLNYKLLSFYNGVNKTHAAREIVAESRNALFIINRLRPFVAVEHEELAEAFATDILANERVVSHNDARCLNEVSRVIRSFRSANRHGVAHLEGHVAGLERLMERMQLFLGTHPSEIGTPPRNSRDDGKVDWMALSWAEENIDAETSDRDVY